MSLLRNFLANVGGSFQVFRRFPVIAPVALLMLIDEMNYSGINNVTIPAYLTNLHLPDHIRIWLIGTITSTFLLSEAIFRIPSGWLSDRFGRARMITAAVFLTTPSFLLSALAPSYQWFFALRAWDGLMAATLFTSIYAIIGDAVPERSRANAMGVINAMYMIGLVAGYAIAGSIDKVTGQPRDFLYVSAVVALLAGITSFAFFHRRPDLNAPHPDVHLEDAERSVVSVTRHLTLLLVTFTQNLALTIIAPFIYVFAVKTSIAQGGLGLTLPRLGMLAGAPLLGVAIFAIPLSRLADKIGKLTAVRIAFILVACTLWIFSATRQLWLLSLAASAVGIAYSMGVPAWLAILSALSGRKRRGATLGGYGAVQGFAAVLGPLIATFVINHPPIVFHHFVITFGLSKIFIASSLLVGFAALLVCVALPEHPGPGRMACKEKV